jgi:hypothetical protein
MVLQTVDVRPRHEDLFMALGPRTRMFNMVHDHALRTSTDDRNNRFQTPIDEQDAASRVLDPIIAPLRALQRGEPIEPPWGVFLKDYTKCEW